MIIVDDGHVSDRMSTYLAQSKQPVLATDASRAIASAHPGVVLVAEDAAAKRIEEGGGSTRCRKGGFPGCLST